MGDRAPGPRYVYTFWDADGACLYVGCTGALGHRLSQHVGGRPWWASVARIDVTVHDGYLAGIAAERAAIVALQPLHNRVYTDHFPSKGGWETRRRNPRYAGQWWSTAANTGSEVTEGVAS